MQTMTEESLYVGGKSLLLSQLPDSLSFDWRNVDWIIIGAHIMHKELSD